MKSFKEFIAESNWKSYSKKTFKQLVEEGYPKEFNGSNGLPYEDDKDDGTVPVSIGAKTEIISNGEKWFHGGRVSVDPVTSKRMYQYVKNIDPINPDVEASIWADEDGNVTDAKYPEAKMTAAINSIKTK
jgi:hypothetical protein